MFHVEHFVFNPNNYTIYMMSTNNSNHFNQFDVIVVGAGHAGCEAALASARLGAKTAVFCLSADVIANLPCNPCIGGTAKGQIVSEVDALGGEIGRAADATCLQSRTLCAGKGEAVRSLRVQSDRQAYHMHMKRVLESQPDLFVIQDEIAEIAVEEGRITGAVGRLGGLYTAQAVIITTGTYLNGRIHVGDASYPGAPDNLRPAVNLSESLRERGVELLRFKTGTPARVHKRSLDFSRMQRQDGDEEITPFSFDCAKKPINQVCCYTTYTNEQTHTVIRENLHRSAMYGGQISGVGPRYCPSIEDKIVRFADKTRHQLFVEPCGLNTEEYYLQGLSTSLPLEVQYKFLRTIAGLENVEIIRPAYAIEYDCCDPLQLFPTLEFKRICGLFGAGQFIGTSGYEEAAGAGIVAGINAARQVQNKEPITLTRDSAYIGVMIDDLVTKGTNEPYRMMTSRAEFRLLLRQDNAPERLSQIGRAVGLLSEERYEAAQSQIKIAADEQERIKRQNIPASDELNRMLTARGTTPVDRAVKSVKLAALIKRPQLTYADLEPFDTGKTDIDPALRRKAITAVKYEGYIATQREQVVLAKTMEKKRLPPDFDYSAVEGLRLEAREKLTQIKPLTVGQAGRISGVNPADVTALLVALAKTKQKKS
jgi:tRNA uridine 5-carboxymethylaminomethyl modification enzyme